MRTQTIFISFSKLRRVEGAVPVVTVALVCNDIAQLPTLRWDDTSGTSDGVGPKILQSDRRLRRAKSSKSSLRDEKVVAWLVPRRETVTKKAANCEVSSEV